MRFNGEMNRRKRSFRVVNYFLNKWIANSKFLRRFEREIKVKRFIFIDNIGVGVIEHLNCDGKNQWVIWKDKVRTFQREEIDIVQIVFQVEQQAHSCLRCD